MAYIPPLNGGRLNASIGGNTAGVGTIISTGTMVLAGGNNITLSQNGSAITISGANAPSGSINFSAGTTSANLAAVTFANSNGINFGLNAGTITASHNGITSQSAQTLGLYGVGNSTQNSSTSLDARSISYNGLGAMSVGFSNSSVQLSVPVVSSISATGGASLSYNGNTISIGAPPAFSAGINTNGNTSGTTGFATNQLVLAGGNNITLSQATGAGGNTLSIIGPTAGGGGGSINFSAGTTSANLAAVTFANSGNVSFGLSNSALTASYSQTNQTANMVSINGSTGNISFTNGGNVSLGGNASAITASYSQSVQTQNNIQALIGGTVAATASTGTVNFANSNGVTFGLNGNTMTASVAAGGGGGVAISGGGTSYSSGTVNLSAVGGALTIASGANQSLNFSVPATSSLSATGAVSISTNGSTISIGAPTQTNQTLGLYAMGVNTFSSSANTADARSLSFSGMGNVSVGMSNGSIQISGANNGGTVSNWEPLQLQYASLTASQALLTNRPYFFKLQPEGYVSATQMMQLVSQSLSVSSNSSYGGRITMSAGIYSANGSTLSLITQSSGTATYQYTISGTTNSSLYSGVKGLTLPMSINMSPGNYWLGVMSNTSLINVASLTISNMVITNNLPVYSNLMGQATAASAGIQEAVGSYSTSAAALPSSAAMSNIVQNTPQAVPMPYIVFKNRTF